MISIDETYIDSVAPNADAAKNGRALVLKGKFLKLCITSDETLMFGECQGSGKTPYQCSCDFIRADSPTHRCSCPSRQFPCKHCLGLMYAYVQKKKFTSADAPADITEKREKMQVRVEKKKETESKPKQVDKGALAKKIKAQLGGLDLLENFTHDLVRLGMGNMNAKLASQMEEQAKQLGNAFLPGAQAALHDYTRLFSGDSGEFDEEMPAGSREKIYGEALDQLTRLFAIIKHGRAYLTKRLEDPELSPETETAIAAWLGHAWQLRELKDAGLLIKDAELAQLAFHSYNDEGKRAYVDSGIWMNLGSGRISITQTIRPYQAAKFIKSEDSFFQVAQIPELCMYPGDINPRCRWDAMTPRPLEAADYTKIRQHGQADFATLIKEIKGRLKNPLGDKRPVAAINFAKVGQAGGSLVAEDAKGQRLVMTDEGMVEEPPTCALFRLLPSELFENQTLVARFYHNLDTRQLRIKPLAIVTKQEIVRLTF